MGKNTFTAIHRLTAIHNWANNQEQNAQIAQEENRQAEIIDRRIADGSLKVTGLKIRELPKGFQPIGLQSIYTTAHIGMSGTWKGLTVISSLCIADDLVWKHVSFSRHERLPNYAEMVMVKQEWVGADRWAIQILVPEADHVNIHPNCLHLWSCLDPFPLPNFVFGGQI